MKKAKTNDSIQYIEDSDGYIGTLQWCARVLSLTPNAISTNWPVRTIDSGPPKLYDIIELVTYNKRRLEERIAKKDEQIKSMQQVCSAKDAFYAAKTQEQLIKNAKLKAELLDKEVVEKVVLDIISQFREAILAIPSRISDQCSSAQTRQETYDILQAEVLQTLQILSTFDVKECHQDVSHLQDITLEQDEVDEIENPLGKEGPSIPKSLRWSDDDD